MSAGSLIAFFVIALVDSINPSALLVTLHLLSRNAPLPAIVTYIGAVFLTYLSVSIMLLLGMTALFEPVSRLLQTTPAQIGLTLLGAGLLAYALFSKKPKEDSASRPFHYTGTSVTGLALLGITVTIMELPTAVPVLGAIGILTGAQLSWASWLPLLLAYNLIFVAPPLLLTFGYRWLGQRGGEKLQARLSSGARETMLWVFGIVGAYLLLQGLESLGVLGDTISIGIG